MSLLDLGSPTLTIPGLAVSRQTKKNSPGPLKWEESAAILREEETERGKERERDIEREEEDTVRENRQQKGRL